MTDDGALDLYMTDVVGMMKHITDSIKNVITLVQLERFQGELSEIVKDKILEDDDMNKVKSLQVQLDKKGKQMKLANQVLQNLKQKKTEGKALQPTIKNQRLVEIKQNTENKASDTKSLARQPQAKVPESNLEGSQALEANAKALAILVGSGDDNHYVNAPNSKSSWAHHEAHTVVDHLHRLCQELRFDTRIPFVAILGMAHDLSLVEATLKGVTPAMYRGIFLSTVPLNKRLLLQYLTFLRGTDGDEPIKRATDQGLYEASLLGSIVHMRCLRNGTTSMRISTALLDACPVDALAPWDGLPAFTKVSLESLLGNVRLQFEQMMHIMAHCTPMHIASTEWTLSDIGDR